MNSNQETKRIIYNALKDNPEVKVSSSMQLETKCFLCGDSKKNPNKKRLGIKCNFNDPDEPVLFNCFNCGAHGIFTVDMLHQMNIVDKELDSALRHMNNNILKDDGTKRVNKYKNTKEVQVDFAPLYKKDTTVSKIKYLYNRVGYQIPIEDFNRLKIIFDLIDFLKVNKVNPNNEYVNILSKDYIGFLSVNNEYIIFRDITDKHKMRYVKYNIFNVFDNTNSFYAIKNSVDLLTEGDINISIAEGAFDIIGLYCNIFNRDITNNICIASCNGSFSAPIRHYIGKGIVGSNVKINCYQDNDTKLNFKKIREEFKPYIMKSSNFSVYYNSLYKDFGVPKEKILIDKLMI